MTALGPLDHIARVALPWRTEPDLTECGKPISELGDRVVSREAVAARIKAIGQQRAAFEICMTCAGTSDRWTRQARRVHVYAWLWRSNQPVCPTDPVWLWPNDTYNPGPIVTVSSVDQDPDPLLQLLAHETGSQGDEG